MASKEIKFKGIYTYFGISKSGFGIGFRVDKYSLSIDLGPFWIGVEW